MIGIRYHKTKIHEESRSTIRRGFMVKHLRRDPANVNAQKTIVDPYSICRLYVNTIYDIEGLFVFRTRKFKVYDLEFSIHFMVWKALFVLA